MQEAWCKPDPREVGGGGSNEDAQERRWKERGEKGKYKQIGIEKIGRKKDGKGKEKKKKKEGEEILLLFLFTGVLAKNDHGHADNSENRDCHHE